MKSVNTKSMTIAGTDYKVGFSTDIVRQLKQDGVNLYHIMAKVFNSVNTINQSLGKQPKFYGDVKPDEKGMYLECFTREEANQKYGEYLTTLDMELTERVTEICDPIDAAKILYYAAVSCNTLIELPEMEENIIIEGISQGSNKSGYQYLLIEYCSWAYRLDRADKTPEEEKEDEKKSSGGSLLQRLFRLN